MARASPDLDDILVAEPVAVQLEPPKHGRASYPTAARARL